MKWVAATGNKKKLAEIQRILSLFGHEVISLNSLNIDIDIEETGETFAENAMLKAKTIYEITGMASVADDSGLCVDALNGAPGVYSARYAGEHGDDSANNAKLLQKMIDVPTEKRTARFVSVIATVFENGTEETFEGICEGTIGTKEKGNKGFGYDPLFYVGEVSFAEMEDAQKDKISHRAKALQKLEEYLRGKK